MRSAAYDGGSPAAGPTGAVLSALDGDGRGMDAEDMTYGSRIACLIYAVDCALLASSEAGFQQLAYTLSVVLNGGGVAISRCEVEASVCRARVSASSWLPPDVAHANQPQVQDVTPLSNSDNYKADKEKKRKPMPALAPLRALGSPSRPRRLSASVWQ